MRGAVDVQPDFGPRCGLEAVDVDVVRRTQEAVYLKPQSQVLVATLFVGSQGAQELSGIGDGVRSRRLLVTRFILDDDLHVPIVGKLINPDAAPVARRSRLICRPAVRVVLREPVQVKAGTDRVVAQRRQDNREPRLPDDLQDAADAVVDVQRPAQGREARIVSAGQLHHQILGRAAFQTQAAVGVEVGDHDLVVNDMDDVGIVPDALRCQRLAADLQSVDTVVN